MIGLVAFVALAVSAVCGQGCSCNGLSQTLVAAPVSGFSGNVLGSGLVGSGVSGNVLRSAVVGSGFGSGIVGSGFGVASAAPSVRSSVVSAPVFLNDGPALMSQATRATSGPLVATPAVSQSVSPAGSVSSFLSGSSGLSGISGSSSSLLSGSVSGGSSFNSAVGQSQVVSVPTYSTPRIPSNQVSSTSVSLPSFPGVSSLNFGSAISSPVVAQSVSSPVFAQSVSTPVVAQSVSSPVFAQSVSTPVVAQAVSTPVVAQSVSVPVSSGVFGSGVVGSGISGFGSGVSRVVESGCF